MTLPYRLTLILILLLISAGCSPSSPKSKQPAQSNADIEAVPPKYTFGIVYPMAHSFYETVTENAELAAKELSIELIVKAPDEANLEQQIRIMETLIRQDVDGIALDPIDSNALAPYIGMAVQAGIPVVCFESDSPESSRLSFIGADNYESGQRIGEAVDLLLRGKGMLLVETGTETMRSLKERLEGFLDYINNETEMDVLEVKYNEGNEERALAELERMIDDHPHFDAFVSLDFISGASSVLVWKAKGLNRYALTLGMMPELEEAIVNGQITAAVSQNESEWGRQIVNQLLQAQDEEPVSEFIGMGIKLVNVQDVKR